MPALTKAAHIARRVHITELPEQGGKKLFGLSLCAAPYFEGATNPPLLQGLNALDPYVPQAFDDQFGRHGNRAPSRRRCA